MRRPCTLARGFSYLNEWIFLNRHGETLIPIWSYLIYYWKCIWSLGIYLIPNFFGRSWCFVCIYRSMGGCSSADFEEPEEEFKIPPGQHWRYSRCTVRAHHKLSILSKKQDCDYCCIVDKVRRKTWYRCDVCNLNFCFNRKRNHFRRWHSGRCDHLRMYTWLWNPVYTLKVAHNHFWLFCTL